MCVCMCVNPLYVCVCVCVCGVCVYEHKFSRSRMCMCVCVYTQIPTNALNENPVVRMREDETNRFNFGLWSQESMLQVTHNLKTDSGYAIREDSSSKPKILQFWIMVPFYFGL